MATNASPDDLFSSFEADLTKLRFELIKSIGAIDVLDRGELEKCIYLFNDRLFIFQHDFLKFINNGDSHAETFVEIIPLIIEPYPVVFFWGLCTTITPFGIFVLWMMQTGWIIIVAALIGCISILAGPVGLVVGPVIGCAAGFGIAAISRHVRRKRIRERIMNYYDKKTVPRLEAWARKQIEAVCKLR